MLKSIKFWIVAVGIGVIAGVAIAGWLHWTKPKPLERTSSGGLSGSSAILNMSGSASSSGGGSSIPVVTDGDQGDLTDNASNGQDPSGDSSGSGSGGSDGSASSDSSSAGLPGPSDFGQYDKYKTSPTALFIDIQPGTGAAIADGSIATVQYQGWLTDGTEFDSTYARKQAYTFTEGAGAVIPGWEEAIFGMKVGGERRLIIPPGLAFGASGHSPIPGNAVLIFDVTLLSIK